MTDLPTDAVAEIATQTFYKSIRPDGTDHYTGTVAWAESECPVTHPRTVTHPSSPKAMLGVHSTSLAASTTPWDLPGAPPDHRRMRLLTVEPADAPIIETDRTKRQSIAWRVTGEIPSWHRYGPMGRHVARLIEQIEGMTPEQVDLTWGSAWSTARSAAWDAAWCAAEELELRDAAWGAARDAAWGAAWGGVRHEAGVAAGALAVRDLIGWHGFAQEHYDALTRPLRLTGITVHPDDGPLR